MLSESRLQILEIWAAETGAPQVNSLDFDRSIEETVRCLKLAKEMQANNEIAYLPVGLVGLITGSKNPFSSALIRLVSALASGNAVIWKPSPKLEKTTASLFEAVFRKLDMPAGLLNVLPASNEIADAIIDHPAIHKLMFVGSTTAGKTLYARASQAGKQIQLSMGARNPAIVFADVDLDKNIESITRSFFDFHGLGRWRASRILVQESIYKSFLEKLTNYLKENSLTYLGSLNSSDKQRFDQAFFQAKQEKGKSLLDQDSKTLSPKVIFDLTNCSTLQQEEIEGPLITVSSFKYQFDALKQANTSPLGKAAFVWSADADKAKKVAKKLEVGRVFINEIGAKPLSDHYVAAKESGIGTEGILDLLQFNSHVVNVT